MASKKSFSIFWRLFVPLFLLLWIIIGIMFTYSVSNEKEIRRESLMYRIKNINTTILDRYEQGESIQQTVDFINAYYDNTSFYDLRVSVFSSKGQIIAHRGIPIETDATGQTFVIPDGTLVDIVASDSGQITVITAVPLNANLVKIMGYNPVVWFIVFGLAIIATILVFLIARRLALMIKNLHRFTVAAADGKVTSIDPDSYPHDEIGDVTRQIITLYRDKDKATKRMIHEHQVALRANEEKARVKRQIANNLNHEIKTPVGIIKGYLDTILSDPDMPEKTRQSFLLKTQEHTNRLTALLRDISSITHLDEAANNLETSNFDFHDLVYNIASDIEAGNLINDMTFDWDIPFDTVVCGNFNLLSNAIMNLVRNSVKYSKGTTMTLALAGESKSHFFFTFADDGIGVDPEHLPHLFDRFYRVDEGRSRKVGGTGLGLSIVKSTITALGGDIDVSNVKPQGLMFSFSLPKESNNEQSNQK